MRILRLLFKLGNLLTGGLGLNFLHLLGGGLRLNFLNLLVGDGTFDVNVQELRYRRRLRLGLVSAVLLRHDVAKLAKLRIRLAKVLLNFRLGRRNP